MLDALIGKHLRLAVTYKSSASRLRQCSQRNMQILPILWNYATRATRWAALTTIMCTSIP